MMVCVIDSSRRWGQDSYWMNNVSVLMQLCNMYCSCACMCVVLLADDLWLAYINVPHVCTFPGVQDIMSKTIGGSRQTKKMNTGVHKKGQG